MRISKFYITMLVVMTLAGCASDKFETPTSMDSGDIDSPIFFGSKTLSVTRASHEASAQLLNNKFWVYGTKTNKTTSPLFDNYLVEYAAGTANLTESNTADWEYVGKTSKKGALQGIKYWDFSAEKYDFVAAAGLAEKDTIKNTNDGLRIKVADADALSGIFIADRITATPSAQAATDTKPATLSYKSTVQFQFRRLGARMRVGFYETVPGYAVKNLVFYYIGAQSGSYDVGVGSAFPSSGVYTVDYDDATNAAVSTFAGSANKMSYVNSFGSLEYTSATSDSGDNSKPYLAADGSASATPDKSFLGTSASEACYGKGYYTIDGVSGVHSDFKPILPNEHNTLKMQLRLDYTLVALDGSGDEIQVRDAYVSVPVEYLQWKPNYSYTYIFRISDKSNGYTGPGSKPGDGPGRDPDPNNGGGDTNPEPDPNNPGEVIPPYIPDPNWPEIPDPDDPGKTIPDPDAPLVPNPLYPEGPGGDQHDPSNPVPTPTIPDPDNPGGVIPDPDNPSKLYPITFDAIVVEVEDGQKVYTIIDGTDNSSTDEH